MKTEFIVIVGLVILGALVIDGLGVLDSEVTIYSDGKWNGMVNYDDVGGRRVGYIHGNGDKTIKIEGSLTQVQVQKDFSGTYVRLVVKVKGHVVFDETDSNYLVWHG